jgi:hypothetical protein
MAAGSRREADMPRFIIREILTPLVTIIIFIYALGFILP